MTERNGRVCEKHQEFAPDSVCRWCEPPPKSDLLDLAMLGVRRAEKAALYALRVGLAFETPAADPLE